MSMNFTRWLTDALDLYCTRRLLQNKQGDSYGLIVEFHESTSYCRNDLTDLINGREQQIENVLRQRPPRMH